MTVRLDAGRARIFRITHIDNVEWIFQYGLHCRNSKDQDPNYREIGNPDLIGKRATRSIPVNPGGTLSDYVPFYFTPYSPMLLNIKTGWNGITQFPMSEIVILVSSLHALAAKGLPFIFSDRHAYLQAAVFFTNAADLGNIDWDLLQARDFKRDPNDPGKVERYQAEALVYRHLPCDALTGVICNGDKAKSTINRIAAREQLTVQAACLPEYYL